MLAAVTYCTLRARNYPGLRGAGFSRLYNQTGRRGRPRSRAAAFSFSAAPNPAATAGVICRGETRTLTLFRRETVQLFSPVTRARRGTILTFFDNGEKEVVGYCQEFYVAGDPQAERDYSAHNQKFYEEVKSRGLPAP